MRKEWENFLAGNKSKIEQAVSKFWIQWKKSEVSDSLDYFYAGYCWENVFCPVFLLNEKYGKDTFKLLIAKNDEDFHIVIINEKEKYIFDPTYEKYNTSNLCKDPLGNIWDHNCYGIDCTIPFLNKLSNMEIISQEKYLSNYKFQVEGQPNLDSQLHEKRLAFNEIFGN